MNYDKEQTHILNSGMTLEEAEKHLDEYIDWSNAIVDAAVARLEAQDNAPEP